MNEQGYAITMLKRDASPTTTKPSANYLGSQSSYQVGGLGKQSQRAIKPLNMQSTSLGQLNQDVNDDEYGDEPVTDNEGGQMGGGLSNISSIERLHKMGGRNTKLTHGFRQGNNSSMMMGGGSLRARARSTIAGPQANAPFQSSGPRFMSTPKQCK